MTSARPTGHKSNRTSDLASLTSNEIWYLALTRRWSDRLRSGGEAGPSHHPAPDIDFAERVLGLRPGMRVLDLAASWGRTSIEFARRGYKVVAFDLSPDLLQIGRERAALAHVEVEFIQGTVRALPELGQFDAVTAFYDDCLLSFEDEADNLAALRTVALALRPGGSLLFGTTDCPPVLPPLQSVWSKHDGEAVEETISFDPMTRVGTSVRLHRAGDGRMERYVRRRRHYLPGEASELLTMAGFDRIGAWCAYDETMVYGARAEGMVLAAVNSRRMAAP